MYLYPRIAPSVAAWSGVFNKTLGSQAFDLSHDERLALKMVNYMVYAECVYANLVNQLCYILANSDSPRCLKELDYKPDMEPIARNASLKRKIKFLKSNLPPMEPGSINITDACNIHLRNMIAHGSLAGNRPQAPHIHQEKPKHQMSEPVFVRRSLRGDWKWCEKSVDLDAEYKKMHDATLIWHNALWCYWDVKFRPKRSL